jgi:two-component system LytT family response regulator
MSYRVVIVDDEIPQQKTLISLLQNFPEFELIGTATSVEEARQVIGETNPDLVFLDVMLPPFTSFDLLESLSQISFNIIFTTSYETYAIRAFRFSAIDYLIKPIVPEELEHALEKFKQQKESQEQLVNIKNMLDNRMLPTANQKVALPTLTGFIYTEIKNLVRCESENSYTTIYTVDNRTITVSKPLRDIEVILTGCRFFRIHNSHLINLDFVTEFFKAGSGTVKMIDGTTIEVSRRRKDEFLQLLLR